MPDYWESQEEDTPQTKFNAGIAKLQRIDKLRTAIHECRAAEAYDNWLDFLVGWRNEINESFNEEESEKKADEFERDILIKIQTVNNKKMRYIQRHGNLRGVKIQEAWSLIQKLNEYERWLAKQEKKYGYSMPDMDDDEGL